MTGFYNFYVIALMLWTPFVLIALNFKNFKKKYSFYEGVGFIFGSVIFFTCVKYWYLGTPVLLDAEDNMQWWFMYINAVSIFGSSSLLIQITDPVFFKRISGIK